MKLSKSRRALLQRLVDKGELWTSKWDFTPIEKRAYPYLHGYTEAKDWRSIQVRIRPDRLEEVRKMLGLK